MTEPVATIERSSLCGLCARQRPQAGACCEKCRDNMEWRLGEIVELYSLLPSLLEPGSDGGGDFITGSREAPLPGRTLIMNLLGPSNPGDGGSDPHGDNHGPLPTLEVVHSWERVVREERDLPAPSPLERLAPWLAAQLQWAREHRSLPVVPEYLSWLITGVRELHGRLGPTVATACAFLSRQLDWICDQEWVQDFAGEITKAHNILRDVCGEHRPKPIGTCPALIEDGDGAEKPCGATLFVSTYSDTVQCRSCGETWTRDRWRWLGQTMGVIAS